MNHKFALYLLCMIVNHQANVKKVNKKVVILSSSNDSWVLLLERNNYDVVRCKDIRELDAILELQF